MVDAVENFVRVATTESLTDTATTVTVDEIADFPSSGYNCVVWDSKNNPRPDQDPDVEIVRVTSIDTSTNTLTIERGQENTAAASHPNGSAVTIAPTAKMFTDIESQLHDKYTDSEAVAAVNGETSLDVDVSGDADSVDGWDIQKNGTDGAGIINFKTQ